jgi:hypothetical protein
MPAATISVRYSDREYRNSHGTAPRGYGNWMFEDEVGAIYEAKGTLTEAKREVTRAIRVTYTQEQCGGSIYVSVLP